MDLIQQGINAFRSSRKEEANSIFTEAVRQNPDSAMAWFWLGKTQDDPARKKACFDRVLKIDPDFRSKIQSGQVQNSNTSSPNPAPTRKPEVNGANESGSLKKILLFGGVGALLLIACLSMGVFAMDKIQHPQINRGEIAAMSNNSEAITGTPMPPLISTQTPWPTFTHLPTVFETPQPETSQSGDATQVYESLGFQITAARKAFDTKQYDQCITSYTNLLQKMPNWTSGYNNRGGCKDSVAGKSHNLETYNQLLDEALADLDKAIAIGPEKNRYFSQRAFIYYHKQLVLENRSSEFDALKIGLENIDVGIRLGKYAESDSEIDKPLFLNGLGRCQESIDLAGKILAENPNDIDVLKSEYEYLSTGYMCLGDYATARRMNEKLLVFTNDCDALARQTRIFIGLGDNDQAYSVIDKCISGSPNYAGDRYYLRALLHWDRGEKDLARQDLLAGAGNTWYHGGLFAYVAGLIAMDEGDRTKAIELFKYAEATVKIEEAPWLKTRIRNSLSGLNISEQEPTPNIVFASTPIIFEQLTPAPPPTQSIPQEQAQAEPSVQEPVPGPGITSQMEGDTQIPTGYQDTIQVDFNQGTGPMDLAPGDYPSFHFRPASPVNVQMAKEIHFTLSPTQPGTAPLQVFLWTRSGGWRMLEPKWGDNNVENPSFFVGSTGDFYVSIRNLSQNGTTHIENASLEVTAELTNGEMFTYGNR